MPNCLQNTKCALLAGLYVDTVEHIILHKDTANDISAENVGRHQKTRNIGAICRYLW